MKFTKSIFNTLIICMVLFISCKPNDVEVQKELQQKQEPGVTVTVKEGVATLEGAVPDDSSRIKAEEFAKKEKGVKTVINNLKLPPPPPPASMGQSLPSNNDSAGKK